MEQPEKIERMMAVFAHPDDGEFGCAGTAAKFAREGTEVIYVLVTDGSKGTSDPATPPTKISQIRYAEQRAAAATLGVKHVVTLGYEDGVLEPSIDLRRAIVAEIRRYKPEVVIAQHPTRFWTTGSVFANHPDHIACGEATLAAVYPSARDHLFFPQLLAEGLQPHKVREAWITAWQGADHFVDITDTIDLKIKALRCHHSQVGHLGPEFDENIRQRHRERAKGSGFEYAESFLRMRVGR